MPATISRDIKIGIARETTWGDGDDPQRLLPIDPPSITEPYEQILDNLLRGINAVDFGAYQGSGHVEMGLSGLFYPEELGYFILAMMGSISTDPPAGTAPTYEHTFTLASQPPSLSIQEEGGVYPSGSHRRFIGMLPSSLTFTFTSSEGLLTWSSDLAGQKGTAVGTAATWEDTEVSAPFLGWHAALEVGGSPNVRLIDCELTLEREAAIRHALDGEQFPAAIYSGGLAVTLSMTFEANSTELNHVLDHDTNKVEITLTSGSDIVVFTMNLLNWGDAPAELDKSGVFITLGASGRAIYDPSTGSPITITLTNTQQSYTN